MVSGASEVAAEGFVARRLLAGFQARQQPRHPLDCFVGAKYFECHVCDMLFVGILARDGTPWGQSLRVRNDREGRPRSCPLVRCHLSFPYSRKWKEIGYWVAVFPFPQFVTHLGTPIHPQSHCLPSMVFQHSFTSWSLILWPQVVQARS